MVLYFSGTGNSKYIAQRIATATEDSLYSINNAIKENHLFDEEANEKLVFVLPTYAWRIPRIVEKWIRDSSFPSHIPAYFLMNCGGEIGNADKYIIKLCNDKEFDYMGCAEIVMPENYLAMFSTPNKEQSERIILKREPDIENCIQYIIENNPLPDYKTNSQGKIMSDIINPLFYAFFVKAKGFTVSDKCIGCQKCLRECPLNNIAIEKGRPIWGNDCTHCMACITVCPTEAIEYGKKSIGKPRYRCPF